MSTTPDLDKTIDNLNSWLQQAEAYKEKLAITDRLLKAYALKYKHTDDGKGGKFANLDKGTP